MTAIHNATNRYAFFGERQAVALNAKVADWLPLGMAPLVQRKQDNPYDQGLLILSREEIEQLLDRDARRLLGISGQDFLRLRAEKKPLKKPAWGTVEMLAYLLD